MLRYYEFQSIKNPSYESYQKILHGVCHPIDIGLHINAVILNRNGNHTICFQAGIHGDEIAGPWAVIRFIERIKEIDIGDIRIVIVPVANPTGFNKGTRRNKNNIDLNRHGCHNNLKGENKVLFDFMIAEGIDFLHTLHEDSSINKFYIYHTPEVSKQLLEEMLRVGGKYFKVHNAATVHSERASKGLVVLHKVSGDCTMEDRLFTEGIPYIVTETPAKLELEKRIELTEKLMETVIEKNQP